MKKLILVSVLLFNVNAIAEEYNVVCPNSNNGYAVIRDIETLELAQEIVQELSRHIYSCKTIKVRN